MKIHPDGYVFIIAGIIITFLGYAINSTLGLILAITTVLITLFFRDPDRILPDIKNDSIISPCDGVIIDVSDDNSLEKGYIRVSIFLSVFDVHVTRIPYNGKIIQKIYKKGLFFHAGSKEALEQNENLLLQIKGIKTIFVRQVAGLLARRIVCYAENEDTVKCGQRYGIIRFGSRMDIYFPSDFKIFVKPGQIMIGGETIIAMNKNK